MRNVIEIGRGIAVDAVKDRLGAASHHRFDHRYAMVGRQQHLVRGADAGMGQRQRDGDVAARDVFDLAGLQHRRRIASGFRNRIPAEGCHGQHGLFRYSLARIGRSCRQNCGGGRHEGRIVTSTAAVARRRTPRRTGPARRGLTRQTRKPRVPRAASIATDPTSPFPNLEEFVLHGGGQISVGETGPIPCAAVASDDHNMQAALQRRKGETLMQRKRLSNHSLPC